MLCSDLISGYNQVAEFSGLLQEIIKDNTEFVRRGRDINA
jgi:hypothetical protein